MNKHLIIMILLGCALPCTAQKSKPIPVIDINKSLADKRPMQLSELVQDIEYVGLKSPVDLTTGMIYYTVGDRHILAISAYYQEVIVFDRHGNFLNTIGKLGPAEDNFVNLASNKSDMSPDEKHFAIFDRSRLKLFNTNGVFIKSQSLPGEVTHLAFLDNGHIIIHRNSGEMKQNSHQILIYNLDLEPTDSLFWIKSPGQPADGSLRAPFDDFYKLQDKIYFRQADNDTLFQLLPKQIKKAAYVMDWGNLKPAPLKLLSVDDFFSYPRIDNMLETKALFLIYLAGAVNLKTYESHDNIVVYDKAARKGFSLSKSLSAGQDGADSVFIENNLDGFNSDYLKVNNTKNVTPYRPSVMKEQLGSKGKEENYTSDNNQAKQKLGAFLNTIDDKTPVLRIVHYKKSKKHYFGNSHEGYQNLNENGISVDPGELYNKLPVRTSFEWPGADWLAGLTYDPYDDTFWLAKFNDRFIEHRNRSGEVIPGGFKVDSTCGIEGVTLNYHDHTFWAVDIASDSALHFSFDGKKLSDGYKIDLKGNGEPLGITYDPSDSTLWIMDKIDLKILHYTTEGRKIGEAIDVLGAGCNNGRGLTYDPRDNSLWIVNYAPNKMVHVNKLGAELPGTFYFDKSNSLPDGVCLETKTEMMF